MCLLQWTLGKVEVIQSSYRDLGQTLRRILPVRLVDMWNGLDGRIVNCNTAATFITHISVWFENYAELEMRANAQRDGHPAEYRWRPLFNAAVWLTPTTRVPCSNAAKTQNLLKLPGVPQTNETISAASGPKFTVMRLSFRTEQTAYVCGLSCSTGDMVSMGWCYFPSVRTEIYS